MFINKSLKIFIQIIQSLLVPLVILIIWEINTKSGNISPYLLPPIESVLNSFYQLIVNGKLLKHIKASLSTVFCGFSLSFLASLLINLTFYLVKDLEKYFILILKFFQIVPPLALIPLLMLYLGIGVKIQLAIIILASFFPLYINIKQGFNSLTNEQQELLAILNLPKLKFICLILLPSAFPFIYTGFKIGFAYAFRALIGAELIAASSGLGFMISDAGQMQQTDIVLVGIFTIAILGFIIEKIISIIVNCLARKRFANVI